MLSMSSEKRFHICGYTANEEPYFSTAAKPFIGKFIHLYFLDLKFSTIPKFLPPRCCCGHGTNFLLFLLSSKVFRQQVGCKTSF